MKSQEIKIFPGITLGKAHEPIEFTSLVKKLDLKKYQIWDYRYVNQEDASGCFFIFPPLTHSAIAYVIDAETEVTQTVTYGSGYCIRTRAMDQLLDVQRQSYEEIALHVGSQLSFHAGDIYFLGSDRQGLVMQDVTTPPFRPGITEVNLHADDHRLPLIFRRTVQTLTQ